MILRTWALGKEFNHEGGALIDGISPLRRDMRDAMPNTDKARRYPSSYTEESSP